MIVDFRTYTLHPGRLGAYLKLYGVEGFPIQIRHLQNCLGYYVVESGVQNRVVHFWGYDDIADRARKRAGMEADPAWNAYRAKAAQFFQRQENQILQTVPFWPLAGDAKGPIGLVDLRLYTLHPGRLGEFFRLYPADGAEIQTRHLGRCTGFYYSDIGTQNMLVHLWAYEDPADRARRRAGLQADPNWNAYFSKVSNLLMHMENVLLRPAPFWPPKAGG